MLLRQESRTSQGVFIGIQILWVMLDIDNIVQKVIEVSHYTVENARLPDCAFLPENFVDRMCGIAFHSGKHGRNIMTVYGCE